MGNGKSVFDLDYSEYDKNNTLSFAMASMMFGQFTNIVVCRRLSDRRLEYLGGGKPYRIMKRYGDLRIVSSIISEDGFLRIMVE